LPLRPPLSRLHLECQLCQFSRSRPKLVLGLPALEWHRPRHCIHLAISLYFQSLPGSQALSHSLLQQVAQLPLLRVPVLGCALTGDSLTHY
jgi:hypothetical protein